MNLTKDIKVKVDKALENLTEELIEREPRDLYESVKYMISMGGKRLRPLLCILSYSLFGNNIERDVLKPALGLEIFHSFTLAHDDIMDRAKMRRGQICLHKKYSPELAVLAGDAMSIYAFELISQCPHNLLPCILKTFAKTAMEICEGQQMDLSFEKQTFVAMEDYLKMISLKTAVFLACSAQIGAICGEASEADRTHMYNFGYNLGLGFQICDDYLDSFGNPAIFGKNIGGDILNNKKTWLLIEAFSRCNDRQKKELEKLMMKSDDPKSKIERVIAIYKDLEIPEYAIRKITQCHERSVESLNKTNGNENIKSILMEYSSSLINRIV
ncbi:MAG: polyprenyl synthetase family protein [Bacteroidales bacterium]|nr:polyprenyl synthetase family protein [Bacteroidales bacterium]